MSEKSAGIVDTTMTVTIDAGQTDVWHALTEQIGEWWPADAYTTREGAKAFKLELWAGGRMYEETDAGHSQLWGNVTCVDVPNKLQAFGVNHPEWGGPTVLFWTWALSSEADGRTRLTFEESNLGVVEDKDVSGRWTAWRYIWNVLKAHVEGSEKPEWPGAE